MMIAESEPSACPPLPVPVAPTLAAAGAGVDTAAVDRIDCDAPGSVRARRARRRSKTVVGRSTRGARNRPAEEMVPALAAHVTGPRAPSASAVSCVPVPGHRLRPGERNPPRGRCGVPGRGARPHCECPTGRGAAVGPPADGALAVAFPSGLSRGRAQPGRGGLDVAGAASSWRRCECGCPSRAGARRASTWSRSSPRQTDPRL